MRRLVLFFCALTAGFVVQSQSYSKMDLGSQRYLQNANLNDIHELFIAGESESILTWIDAHGLKVKYIRDGWIVVRAELKLMEELDGMPFISKISLLPNRGRALIERSKSNSNVRALHSTFFNGGLSGKGVLIGFLDSGIEIQHPDFKDENGRTRIVSIWDQTQPVDPLRTPSFGYGQVWDSTSINSGSCTHIDQNAYFGHGSGVAGIAAGNGLSVHDTIGDFSGYAPKASIAMVSIDFSAPNFTEKVADGVEYIFSLADSLGMPCVVNASLGSYLGSHDGKDVQAQRIDSMIRAKEGRAMVAAAGNSGNWGPYHMRTTLNGDSAFTWFLHNSSNNSVFIEIWADTGQFNQVEFAMGGDDPTSFARHGQTAYSTIQGRLNMVVSEPLMVGGSTAATVLTWAERQGPNYLLQYYLPNPDSSHYNFALLTRGIGEFDTWSTSNLGHSDMVYVGVPGPSFRSDFASYRFPDVDQSMVSSFTCLESVITVGNYYNTSQYMDYGGNTQTFPEAAGSIALSSSRGPTRTGVLKPEVSAPGDRTFCPGRFVDMNIMKNVPSLHPRLAPGGFHIRQGGTSMACPVVAGMAALMLEHCPKLDFQEVMDLIRDNTRSDQFTGTSFSKLYGYGKADATAALEALLYQVPIGSPTNLAHCDMDSATIYIDMQVDSILWSSGSASDSINGSHPQTLWATVWDDRGCPGSTDTANFSIIAAPQDFLPMDTGLCFGVNYTLDPGSFGSYSWSTGSQSRTIVVSDSGAYIVTVTDAFGCAGSDTFDVHSIYAPAMPDLGPDTQLCSFQSIILNPGSFSIYEWNDDINTPTRTVYNPGTYSVSVTTENGCTGSDQIVVTKDACAGLNDLGEKRVLIYPNPSTGLLFLEGKYDVEVFDARGRMCLSEEDVNRLNLRRLQPGIYSVVLSDGARIDVHQISFQP